MSFKEYTIDDKAVHEWLPWGGLTKPYVVQQKDGSFFSIIKYEPYILTNKIKYRDYKRGWIIWCEKQHKDNIDEYYLVVCWNPFNNNKLEKSNSKEENLEYFFREMKAIEEEMRRLTSCKLLTYQEVLNFLSFTLSFGEDHVLMPEIPLYLDVLLSQNIKIDFTDNGLNINDKNIMVLSLTANPAEKDLNNIFELFVTLPYRYVRRMLLLDKKSTEDNMGKYMNRWCSSRFKMKKRILDGLISNLNGYYSETIFVSIAQDIYEEIAFQVTNYLDKSGISYLLESYNAKDIWWGSIAGIFRANITPPITGFNHFEDFLITRKEKIADVSIKSV